MEKVSSALEIIERMGIKIIPPDYEKTKEKAVSLCLELTQEEIERHHLDILNMYETENKCSFCSALETCQNEPPGYKYGFTRGMNNRLYFTMGKCNKLKQYEELLRNEQLLQACKIPPKLRLKSFKSFDPTENPEAHIKAAEFIRGNAEKGLVLYGPTGVGKTHLAAAVFNNRIISGCVGIYAAVPDLMDSLRSAMRKNTIDEAREALVETELLFLDDLGTENPSEFVTEELFKIINGRNLYGKKILATTNLPPADLRERYTGFGGARIVSRLYESCEWLEMKGKDHRQQ